MKIKSGIKRYVGFMKADLTGVIGIETPLSMIKDMVRIRGRSDFIYENQKGEIVLMDYKSRTLASIDDTHVDLQLKFYADALSFSNDLKKSKLEKNLGNKTDTRLLKGLSSERRERRQMSLKRLIAPEMARLKQQQLKEMKLRKLGKERMR